MTLRSDKIDFLCDLQTGDLDLTSGLRLSTDIQAVGQGAMIRAKLIKGELFFNRDQGVPYIATKGLVTTQEAILGGKFDRPKFETALRTALEASPNVLRVLLLEITEDRIHRRISSRWQLRTAFGDTPLIQLVH